MPLYDYQCKKCQAVFEVRAPLKEKEAGLEPECPECHSKKTNQLLTSGVFLRKSDGGVDLRGPGRGPNAGPGCCVG